MRAATHKEAGVGGPAAVVHTAVIGQDAAEEAEGAVEEQAGVAVAAEAAVANLPWRAVMEKTLAMTMV